MIEIKPGVGVGSVYFGCPLSVIEKHYGKPDIVETGSFGDDLFREYIYELHGVEFRYDKDKDEEDFQLINISIRSMGYSLFGKDLYKWPKAEAVRHVSIHTREIPVYSPLRMEEGVAEYECVEYVRTGISLYFLDGHISSIEVMLNFEDDGDTPIWPQPEE